MAKNFLPTGLLLQLACDIEFAQMHVTLGEQPFQFGIESGETRIGLEHRGIGRGWESGPGLEIKVQAGLAVGEGGDGFGEVLGDLVHAGCLLGGGLGEGGADEVAFHNQLIPEFDGAGETGGILFATLLAQSSP